MICNEDDSAPECGQNIYLKEVVGVQLDAILVPRDMGSRIPFSGTHEDYFASKDVFSFKMGPI